MPSSSERGHDLRPEPRPGRGAGVVAVGKLDAVRVVLLGGFRVSVGARTIEEDAWRLRKAAGLVKLLALAPGHRLHRERAMELLWPDLDPKAAANNLHHALHVARRTLDPGSDASARYLRLRDAHLELCPESPLWVDVEAFEEAAATARRAWEPAAYRAAVDLYAGELLPEDRYEDWAEGRREELRRLYVTLLFELGRSYEAGGAYGEAVEAFERAVMVEPAHEEAHAGLMRLYAAGGRPFKAILQYQQLRENLRGGLSREPDAASRRLYREVLAGRLPVGRPATVRSLPEDLGRPLRHNLPEARSSFIGRERERVEVRRALAMTRLLTLTGPGGCGKTRLALEVAGELVASCPDGVWAVELAPLAAPELVPQAVAGALGVREEPTRPILSALVNELREKDLLLVLDNCEHLLDACARLVDALLASCPRLRVLATSREALNVEGEVIWLVRPLSVPEENRPQAVEQLSGYESVRLFVERTRLRLPAFELKPENVGAVAEVCRKLDGIPLAIELATARMGVLALEGLVERLDDSLGLLTGGVRTAEPRQRTLRGALDWSYGPLSEPERALFDRLSVFAGGWTFEATEAVCSGDGIVRSEVLDLLGSLASKSLVTVETRSGALRYGLLEPVRQYGRERLEERGEADTVRRRHAEYYLALAEEAGPELLGAQAVPALERLRAEHDNLRAALSWALDPAAESEDRTEMGLRLATALERFWLVYGVGEGRGWLERGLAKSGASPYVRARALNQAGWIALFQGGQDRAIAMLEESLALFKELGDKPGMATSLTNLGFAVAHLGDSRRVAAMREEAEALRREPLDRRTLAHLLHFLTLAALDAGDLEQALCGQRESLTLHRELGDIRGIAISLTALGMTMLKAGEPERAKEFFAESLNLLRRMGEKMGIAYCLLGLAGVAGEQVRPDRAARLWGAAEALREAIGMDLSPFDRAHSRYEERLANARSLMDEESWGAAWAQGRAMSPEEAIEYALSEGEDASIPEPPPDARPSEALTPRERGVAALVARGLTNRQIATELSISERTVHTHVRRILRKLGLGSRAQITAWVIEDRFPRDGG
jgi:predicted ATPase/DNA-binding SARP family transcriptional activator/DNA-binding CsgD family transcriptional regulator